MKSFDINNFDINKNYSLQASAGTGKTYNMVKIISKLKDHNIDINKILVVTYTDKAAGELKLKIKDELGQDLTDAHIGTIHSFCQETLREFYFDMDLPANLVVIDDSKRDDFYECYIREKLYAGELDKESLKEKSSKNNIKELSKKLYLDKKYKIVPEIIDYDKFILFCTDLKIRLEKLKDASDYEIDSFFTNFDINSVDDEDIQTQYKLLIDEYKELLASNDSNSKNLIDKFHENIKKNAKFLKGSKYSNLQLPQIVKISKILSNKENLEYDLYKYLKFAIEFYRLWQEEKEYQGWITFDDMLREVREAVMTNPKFKEKLQAKYQYVLIDEFQDTNQIQWDIFKNTFLDCNKCHIIVVGDKKQSIYSFQGANVDVYEAACKEIIAKGEECVLPNNYRSSKSIINGYNELFKTNKFAMLNYSDVKVGNDKIKTLYKGKEIKGIGIVASKNQIVSNYEYAKNVVSLFLIIVLKMKMAIQIYRSLIMRVLKETLNLMILWL